MLSKLRTLCSRVPNSHEELLLWIVLLRLLSTCLEGFSLSISRNLVSVYQRKNSWSRTGPRTSHSCDFTLSRGFSIFCPRCLGNWAHAPSSILPSEAKNYGAGSPAGHESLWVVPLISDFLLNTFCPSKAIQTSLKEIFPRAS